MALKSIVTSEEKKQLENLDEKCNSRDMRDVVTSAFANVLHDFDEIGMDEMTDAEFERGEQLYYRGFECGLNTAKRLFSGATA
jgi:methionine synthase II (cobalamin-independent)